jgi:hypothetical protein
MKKTLAISMMALTLMFGAVIGEASAKPAGSTTVGASNASAVAAAPQRWNRRSRTRYITRTVWQGRRLYRVTYRVTTLWNGRTYSQMVSRVRIR